MDGFNSQTDWPGSVRFVGFAEKRWWDGSENGGGVIKRGKGKGERVDKVRAAGWARGGDGARGTHRTGRSLALRRRFYGGGVCAVAFLEEKPGRAGLGSSGRFTGRTHARTVTPWPVGGGVGPGPPARPGFCLFLRRNILGNVQPRSRRKRKSAGRPQFGSTRLVAAVEIPHFFTKKKDTPFFY